MYPAAGKHVSHSSLLVLASLVLAVTNSVSATTTTADSSSSPSTFQLLGSSEKTYCQNDISPPSLPTPYPPIPTVSATTPLQNGSSSSSSHYPLVVIGSTLKPKGVIPDSCCAFDTVDSVNLRLAPQLQQLVETKFFRNYKINLRKKCLFWQDGGKCNRRDCSVIEIDDLSEIPKEWESNLGDVDFTPSSFGMNSLSPFKKCDYTTKDFCVLDDEASADGVYVDLLKNPERFTGYDGEAAHRIWRSIYEENCFTLGAHHFNKDNGDSSSSSVDHPFDGLKLEECMEKRVFYKLISGLHSSITTHICSQNLNKETGEWFSDLECYVNRVASFPDRVENVYFTYVVILRAISKLSTYLKSYDFCTGDDMETVKVKSLVDSVLSTTLSCPSQFDEKLMFTSKATEYLKEEFKDHFRNVSRIMDCVTCEKCRLWGKLQVSGLGTALKVLFSYTDKAKDYKLTRSEIVALFNAFNRLSNSIMSKEKFRIMYQELVRKEELVLQEEKARQEHKKTVSFDASEMFSLEFTGIIDPRFYVSYTLGAIIFVLGFFKLLHKGHIMDVKYKMEEKQAAKGEELKKRNKSLASKGSKSKRQSSTHRLSVAMDKRASGASYSSNGSPSSAGSSSSSDTLDSSLSDSSPISPLVSPASSKIKNTTSKKKTSLSKKSRK